MNFILALIASYALSILIGSAIVFLNEIGYDIILMKSEWFLVWLISFFGIWNRMKSND